MERTGDTHFTSSLAALNPDGYIAGQRFSENKVARKNGHRAPPSRKCVELRTLLDTSTTTSDGHT